MKEIGALRDRGHTEVAIAERIGVSVSWVSLVLAHLDRGEERLLSAVETGLLPITLAVAISRAGTAEAQDLLLEASDSGKLRGNKLAAVRPQLTLRLWHGPHDLRAQ